VYHNEKTIVKIQWRKKFGENLSKFGKLLEFLGKNE